MRAIVVGEDPLARAGLAKLLAEIAEVEVVATTAPDESLPPVYRAYSPDAILWDVGWANEASDWRDLLSELADSGAQVVTLLPDRQLSAEAWVAGARGLLSREADPKQILAAMHAVVQGLATVDPTFGGAFLPSYDDSEVVEVEDLTAREREVLELLAEGLSNRAIALQLDISEHTVKYHVNAILRKLGAQSRTEAVVRATRRGLILL